MVYSIFSAVEFDTRGIMSLATGYRDSSDVIKALWSMESFLNLEKKVKQNFSFLFKNKINGGLRNLKKDERTIPFVNNLYLGLLYDRNSQFYAGVSNDIFGTASKINPEYVSENSSIRPRTLSSGNIGVHLNSSKWKLSGDFNYFRFKYDFDKNRDTNITITDLSKAIDDDLWSDISLTFKPNKKLYLSIGSLMKSDFSSDGAFNYSDHYFEFGGNHTIKLGKNRLYLPWSIAEHYRVSEQLYLRNEAEGYATLIYIRPVFKLRKRRYLKFATKLDLSSKNMRKQWYDIALRKIFKKKSSLEIGYWTVLGSYFPRQALKINSTLISGKFKLKPSVKLYLRHDIKENSYRYYRTDLSLEFLHNIFKNSELFWGLHYSRYHNLKLYKTDFQSFCNFYLGIRKW